MGVYWNSKAEILTANRDQAKEILMLIKSTDITNNHILHDINICNCSIIFSSRGYGDYGSLFNEICNTFKFPVFCHERVLPCQGQRYGFFSICGRWQNGVVVSCQENIFYDPEDRGTDFIYGSVQYLNIPVNWLNGIRKNMMSNKKRDSLNAIMQRAIDNGTPIQSVVLIDEDGYDSGITTYYLKNFTDNCIPTDEEIVNEIFEDEFRNMCTVKAFYSKYSNSYFLDINLYDENDNEIDSLPENIDYSKRRLVFYSDNPELNYN